MEWLLAGQRLQRARTRWLLDLQSCRNVLSVGEGHGRFAEAFACAFPGASLTCVDGSAGMLQRAQRRVRRSGSDTSGVRWMQHALPEWSPAEGRFDGIVTHFFLDCFAPETLGEVVRILAAAAAPEATWLVADFSLPAAGWKRRRARVIHRLMYWFFSCATGIPAREFTAPDEWLTQSGFANVGRADFEWGLIRADKWVRTIK